MISNQLLAHPHKQPSLLIHNGTSYVLPSQSRFLLSDDISLRALTSQEDRFDLIVVDPPWDNKSVKRGNRYNVMSLWDIKSLPVGRLCNPNAIVVVWITNKPKIRQFVTNELFPAWNVTLKAEWYWVKVTAYGEFVVPLESTHKRTYEPILIGQWCGNRSPDVSTNPKFDMDDNKIICSVPHKLHSKKPHIGELIRAHYMQKNESVPKMLELFARNLLPRWTSWGNEVLKFQEMSNFEPIQG